MFRQSTGLVEVAFIQIPNHTWNLSLVFVYSPLIEPFGLLWHKILELAIYWAVHSSVFHPFYTILQEYNNDYIDGWQVFFQDHNLHMGFM